MRTPALPRTLGAFFWHFLKKYRFQLLFIQLFSFAWSFDHTLWPYVIMRFVDAISNFTGDRTFMWDVLSSPVEMGLTLWICLEISFRTSGILLARFLPKVESDVRLAMFEYVLEHSHTYFGNKMAGTIANKISDMPQSMTRILQQIIQLFIPVLLAIVISTSFFFHIHPGFAWILAGWVLVHGGICFCCAGTCDRLSNAHAETRSTLSGKIVDALTNNTNIRLFARQSFEREYLQQFQAEELQKHISSLWYIEKMKLALGVASFLGVGLAINWYMLSLWQQGLLSTGEVVFIFNTVWNITMMAWMAGLELPQLFKEVGVCRQALSIIQDSHDILDAKEAKPLWVSAGEITFENVTFHYEGREPLFRKKNLHIAPGEKIGLVGFSGSGKTSLINLILRHYEIAEGTISIDGQNIARVTQNSLRSQIALIPQDPSLFHRSLMENIRYGRLDASDAEVQEAAKIAHCHEFILKMEGQYQALVGERGVKLSGGQRQRIAIARAILKNAPILILDEATSALDSVTEKAIQSGLDFLMQKRTTIVIAHRLSTLAHMDRILVFKEGQIVEEGTHLSLLGQQGHYAKLWEMQAGGFLPEEE